MPAVLLAEENLVKRKKNLSSASSTMAEQDHMVFEILDGLGDPAGHELGSEGVLLRERAQDA